MTVLDVTRRPEDKTKVAIVILDVFVSLVDEFVFAKAEHGHDGIIKFLGTTEIRHCNVDMIDSNDFDAHGIRDDL